MFRKIASSLCFALFLGLLSACSPDDVLRLTRNESSSQNTKKTTENSTNNKGIGAPIALPPRFNHNEPLKPGQIPNDTLPNGLPALQPMKGINVDTLFSEELKNSDDRFGRVENAVVDLRKEFEVYKPAIVRLVAVESDIQNLIKELEVVLQETPAQQPPLDLSGNSEATLDIKQLNPQPQAPPELAEVPKERPPDLTKPKSKPPPHTAVSKKPPERTKRSIKHFDGSVALNFRIGEHSDKVRVAFDTNRKTPFNIDLDNEEKLVIIELPEARWEGNKSMSFPDSKLFESMNVEPIGDQGSMIVLTLKRSTKILRKKTLDQDESVKYHRIYFDLEP